MMRIGKWFGIIALYFIFQFGFLQLNAQGINDLKQHFKLTGFIKSNYWLDSRKVEGSREDLFLYYPKKPVLDINGNDVNSGINSNYSAINTRLTLTITGPDVLNAHVTGLIESDYTGVTNADVNGLRLRHAYIKLKWANDELMLGQYWHPMFVPEVFPEVLAFNTGAPFQPFIRNPLVSYKHYFGDFSVQAALIMQRDNSSDGPIGRSAIYMQEAAIPNSHLQLHYKKNSHIFGAAVDFKIIQPLSITNLHVKTDELLPSTSLMAFWKYSKDKVTLQMKSIYGQNLTEHLMLGGYVVATRDSLTGIETYTPTNHLFVWGGMHYGERYRFGMFGGFAKNFGTSRDNIGVYYTKGADVDYLFRLAPSFCFHSGPLRLGSEIEFTAAAIGTPDLHGRIEKSSLTSNVRLLLVAAYFFNN